VLRHLPRFVDPNLLVGDNPADDAAVYRLSDELALVQTVDFFTPIVDDPYDFGRIAAANALSDVYAVGGTPISALNIVGFPIDSLSADILGEILRGGADMAASAGIAIVGGHTVDDNEPKYGLAVTGTVNPAAMITTRNARPGDVLVLTKPLGTGTLATAAKAESLTEWHLRHAIHWMTTLNRAAGSASVAAGVHAATDITGFGLLGHLADLCLASGVSAVVDARHVPILPGARATALAGFVPGGTNKNLAHLDDRVRWEGDTFETWRLLLADPQTSGGLLVAMGPERVGQFRHAIGTEGVAVIVGRVTRQGDALVTVAV
jgi:selenide, water dikinase